MLGPFYVTTEGRRFSAWGPPCETSATAGKVVLNGKTYSLHKDAVGAFAIFEDIRAKHNYQNPGTDTGFYNCRHMQHNPSLPWSYHSWGMALDLNWLQNPAGNKLVTDQPKAFRDELLALRTNSGARVFRWGGDWDWDGETNDHSYIDAMHWELVAHPLDVATGYNYSMSFLPIKEGDGMSTGRLEKKEDVRRLQRMLIVGFGADLDPDGAYGPDTVAAMKDAGFGEGTGIGGGTWYDKLEKAYLENLLEFGSDAAGKRANKRLDGIVIPA